MIKTSIPCLVTTSFRYILVSLSKGSVSLIGVKIADLVSRSTITQIGIKSQGYREPGQMFLLDNNHFQTTNLYNADIPEADTPPRKRLLLTTPRPGCEVGESSAAAAARQPGPTIETRLLDTERRMMTALEMVNMRKDCAAVRAEIESVLETEVRRHEWQRQAADDFAIRHIMRTQALEAGARVDTLEDTGRSSYTLVMIVATMQSVKFLWVTPS
ncbi:hypothetical protein Tco_1061686 [Tanacetum coccineum]